MATDLMYNTSHSGATNQLVLHCNTLYNEILVEPEQISQNALPNRKEERKVAETCTQTRSHRGAST